MSNISAWSTTAASNNASPPNGAPEGMSPASVNDCIRECMAAIAKFYKDTQGTLVTTGSANAYVLTTNNAHASLAAQSLIVFRANFTNTSTCTLNVDGLGAKTIKHRSAALVANAILQNEHYAVTYNATNDCYDLHTVPNAINQLIAGGLTYPAADGTANYYLTTNGAGTLSFAAAAQNIGYSARTANTILAAGDKAVLIDITANSFSQTFTAAATLGAGWYCYYKNSGTGLVTLDPNGTETINGSTTVVLGSGESALIACDGTNFQAIIIAQKSGDHIVEVHTGNGHGATNTKIRRFSTTLTNTGTAITYADSANNGASFTINTAGFYAITYGDGASGGTCSHGVSVNSAALTTNIDSITASTRKAITKHGAVAGLEITPCSCVIKLTAGDVVRPHTDGVPDLASALCSFSITKISNA